MRHTLILSRTSRRRAIPSSLIGPCLSPPAPPTRQPGPQISRLEPVLWIRIRIHLAFLDPDRRYVFWPFHWFGSFIRIRIRIETNADPQHYLEPFKETGECTYTTRSFGLYWQLCSYEL
jgi:hypothetical protein